MKALELIEQVLNTPNDFEVNTASYKFAEMLKGIYNWPCTCDRHHQYKCERCEKIDEFDKIMEID